MDNISAILNMIVTLETTLMKSPYNFDIKLRLVLFYELMGCPEKIVEILRTLDIKSIQHDTLGFLYGKIYFNYSNPNLIQDFFTSALNFYSENLRESKESMLACIKNGSYERIDEFESYDQWIDNSYFKQICSFTKLESFLKSNKFDQTVEMNIDFYIKLLSRKLQDKASLTWNIDMNVLKLSIFGTDYWSYFDIFNSFDIFKAQFLRLQLENYLRKPENIDEIFEEFDKLLLRIKNKTENFHEFDGFKRRNQTNPIIPDIFTTDILKKRADFELLNLEFEKNLFFISKIGLNFKQEEKLIDDLTRNLKDLGFFYSYLKLIEF